MKNALVREYIPGKDGTVYFVFPRICVDVGIN